MLIFNKQENINKICQITIKYLSVLNVQNTLLETKKNYT